MSPVTLFTLRQRVSKTIDVPTRDPNVWMHQDGSIDSDHVLTVSHHRFPPLVFDVPFQLDPNRSVVVKTSDPTVYLAALEYETSPFAEAHYGIQVDVVQVAFQCV